MKTQAEHSSKLAANSQALHLLFSTHAYPRVVCFPLPFTQDAVRGDHGEISTLLIEAGGKVRFNLKQGLHSHRPAYLIAFSLRKQKLPETLSFHASLICTHTHSHCPQFAACMQVVGKTGELVKLAEPLQ